MLTKFSRFSISRLGVALGLLGLLIGFALAFSFASHRLGHGPELMRFKKPRGFLFEDAEFRNTEFFTDSLAVFPVCTSHNGSATVCGIFPGRALFARADELEEVAPLSPSTSWILRAVQKADDTYRFYFSSPAENTALAGFHPASWIESDLNLNLTRVQFQPAQPSVDYSIEEPQSSAHAPATWSSVGAFTTRIEIPGIAQRGLEGTWMSPQEFDLRLKDFAPTPLTIILDPGHGGPERGACEDSLCEAQLTLSAAQMIKAELERLAPSALKVLLTRDNDTSVSLADRVLGAEKNKPGVLVSIHFDSWPDDERGSAPKGVTCYYSTPISYRLCKQVHEMAQRKGLRTSWIARRKLYVLHSLEFPSVLLELGNLRDPHDLELLSDPRQFKRYINSIAGVLFESIK